MAKKSEQKVTDWSRKTEQQRHNQRKETMARIKEYVDIPEEDACQIYMERIRPSRRKTMAQVRHEVELTEKVIRQSEARRKALVKSIHDAYGID